MIGSVLLAPLADRFCRRMLFQVSLIAYATLSLVTALSPNLGVFLMLRVLTGVGLGAELTLVDTYLSELLPSARRGRYVAWSYTFGLLAVPVAGVLAKAANGTILGVAGWRWLLVLASAGGLAVWLLRRHLPESPRWLAATGNLVEADRVLTGIERQVGASAPPVVEVIEPATQGPAATPMPGAPGSYRRRAALLWVMWILVPIGFYGF